MAEREGNTGNTYLELGALLTTFSIYGVLRMRPNLLRLPSIFQRTFVATALMGQLAGRLIAVPDFPATLAMMCRHVVDLPIR
jgi:hypothetical protein